MNDRLIQQWMRASTTETFAEYWIAYEERLSRLGFIGGSLPDWWQAGPA